MEGLKLKYLITFILLSSLGFAQIQQQHLSVIARKNVAVGGGGAGIPDIIYADSAFTISAGADTLGFDHWESIEANQFIMLVLFKEASASAGQWGTGADTVSEAGWTFVYSTVETSAGDNAIGVFTKVATGSETGHFTVHAKEVDEASGWYFVLDSVNVADPINIIGDTTVIYGAANASSITLESATTDANNCLAFGLDGVRGLANFAYSDSISVSDSGWEFYKLAFNRISGFTAGGMIALKDMPTLGATGTVVMYSGYPADTGNDAYIGFIIAIEGINP